MSKYSISQAVAEFAPQYGVRKAFLFGSFARNEFDEQSDIDICIEPDDHFTLFKLGGLAYKLESALGRSVDLICGENSFYPRAQERYEQDKVLIYAQS